MTDEEESKLAHKLDRVIVELSIMRRIMVVWVAIILVVSAPTVVLWLSWHTWAIWGLVGAALVMLITRGINWWEGRK